MFHVICTHGYLIFRLFWPKPVVILVVSLVSQAANYILGWKNIRPRNLQGFLTDCPASKQTLKGCCFGFWRACGSAIYQAGLRCDWAWLHLDTLYSLSIIFVIVCKYIVIHMSYHTLNGTPERAGTGRFHSKRKTGMTLGMKSTGMIQHLLMTCVFARVSYFGTRYSVATVCKS
jgi:hypothetical protein